MELLSVSEAAREIERREGKPILPRQISTLFYERKLRDDLCPIVAGRRLIPDQYLDMIIMALRRAGHLPISTREVCRG